MKRGPAGRARGTSRRIEVLISQPKTGGVVMADVTIQATKNGPYMVNGVVTLKDGEGKTIPTGNKPIALCRCGGSKNKPFCDATHVKANFQA